MNENTKKYMTVTPAADVLEGTQGWKIRLDLPGVSKDTPEINLEDRLLKIGAESSLIRHGLAVRYERAFQISDEIDHQHIAAVLKDGVLELTLPKAETARARKIQVIGA